jgi:hypothetical protein
VDLLGWLTVIAIAAGLIAGRLLFGKPKPDSKDVWP